LHRKSRITATKRFAKQLQYQDLLEIRDFCVRSGLELWRNAVEIKVICAARLLLS